MRNCTFVMRCRGLMRYDCRPKTSTPSFCVSCAMNEAKLGFVAWGIKVQGEECEKK